MTRRINNLSISTLAIHGNHPPTGRGPVTTPIYQTSTYRLKDSNDAIQYAKGNPEVLVYTRYHNPTTIEVEKRIAAMEGAEECALFSSGMAAITAAVMATCSAGDEMVSTPALYGGTYRYFRDDLARHQVHVKHVDPRSLEDLLYLITPRTKLVYLESPTNPTLGLVDIRRMVELTRKAEREHDIHVTIMCDNTFATILNQNPFAMGVDVIMESATKYLGGHADVLAGVLLGKKKFIRSVREVSKHLGATPDPFMSYLLARSLKTFELRVRRQCDNAMALAKALEKQPKVARVIYPGLPSHPQHTLARKQMSGFGGMVTIEVRGGVKAAARVADHLRVALNAMSLGGVETLVSIPVYSSHINMTTAELEQHGVTPGMIRISVGVEDVEDLIADFRQALGKA